MRNSSGLFATDRGIPRKYLSAIYVSGVIGKWRQTSRDKFMVVVDRNCRNCFVGLLYETEEKLYARVNDWKATERIIQSLSFLNKLACGSVEFFWRNVQNFEEIMLSFVHMRVRISSVSLNVNKSAFLSIGNTHSRVSVTAGGIFYHINGLELNG